MESIKLSQIIELNSESNKLRRIGNKKLPELQLLKNKRKASNDENEEKQESDDEEVPDNVILKISSEKDTEIKWKTMSDEFKNKNKALNVVYFRFTKSTGHIGVRRKKNEILNFTDKMILENTELTIEKCEGDDLINFWKEHGKHFEMCLSDNDRKKGIKRKEKKKKNVDKLKETVVLGGET